MKITQVNRENKIECIQPKRISQEQLQREYNYIRAEKLLETMLQKGLITKGECNKVTELNRKTFSPYLAEIMP